MPLDIHAATPDKLDDVLPLFAGYQTFYAGAPQDDARNRAFLERFAGGGAGRLLVARNARGNAVGFANLYFTFESVAAREHVHLNDLFVAEAARGAGVGKALIDASAEVARERGSQSLTWFTALDNRRAQAVYERTGAGRSTWFEYELEL